MKGKIMRRALRWFDALTQAERANPEAKPEHLVTGARGEEDAYFYLREQGYTVVARNYRSPRHRGEIDLIAWDGDILCFIEVKTRTGHTLVPAEMAVDAPKESLLRATARDYLRRVKGMPAVRFDIVSLYYEGHERRHPDITLFKNAFPMS